MASSVSIPINETASVLLFHGKGTVILFPAFSDVLIGGSDVSAVNGTQLSAGMPHIFQVNSEDSIYGIQRPGTGVVTAAVGVFNCK